jgi:hypothetical protein
MGSMDLYSLDKISELKRERLTRDLEFKAALGLPEFRRQRARHNAASVLRRVADRLEPRPEAGARRQTAAAPRG